MSNNDITLIDEETLSVISRTKIRCTDAAFGISIDPMNIKWSSTGLYTRLLTDALHD